MSLNYGAAKAALSNEPFLKAVESRTELQAMTLADFLTRKFPPREMQLAPWLPKQGLAMVFAPRGIGKTHFSLGVAYAVATGTAFLRWSAPKPRKVLVLDGEMPAAALQERWAMIVQQGVGDLPADEYVRILASDVFEFGLPDLATIEGQQQLEPAIGDAELIVVDNLSTLARSGKENESESWATMQAWALAQRRAGRTVLFVHHAGKGGEQRGTSKREDVMDSVVKLARPSDYHANEGARFEVHFTKSRGFAGEEAQPFEASLCDGKWATRDLADVRTAQILALKADGLTQREIASEVGCGIGTVNRTLKAHEG